MDDELNLMNNKVQQRLIALQDNIANYREEYDFVVQLRSIVNKRLQDLKVCLLLNFFFCNSPFLTVSFDTKKILSHTFNNLTAGCVD